MPTVEEYLKVVQNKIDPLASELYRYLNFNEIDGFENEGRIIAKGDEPKIEEFTADCNLVSYNFDLQVSLYKGDLEGFSYHLFEHKLL